MNEVWISDTNYHKILQNLAVNFHVAHMSPVVGKMDNAIYWVNFYPVQWIAQLVSLILIR